MGSKSREDLYKLFKTGNKPTEDDFADLIDSMINIAEDGIGVSEKGEPMELVQQGTKQRWLDFSSSKDSPVWRINAQSESGVNGLNVATADSTSRLYLKRENGFIGVNNDAPDAQLHIAAASGAALQVDCGAGRTALVIDGDGNLGIGTTSAADCRVTVDGKVKLQGETTIDGAVLAQKGLTVSGATLTAEQGLRIENGATIENGLLAAKAGLTVSGEALNVNAGAIVSGLALQARNGLNVTDGAVIETGTLEAQAGGVFSGAALEARDGFTASKGAVISGGRLEAQAGANVSGAALTAENGLTVTKGAVIETGNLTARQGLIVNQGAVVETGELAARQGLTVNQGAVIESGELAARQGLTVNQGAVIESGELAARQGLIVNQGAVIESGELAAQQGLVVNQGAVIETGALQAKNGLTVNGALVIEDGLVNAKGGLTVPNGSAFTAEGQVVLGNAASGTVVSNGLVLAKQGLKVENAGLEARAGAAISGAALLVEQGLTVSNGATFEAGMLTAKAGVTVSEGATLSATGPVTLGNATDGKVTVNGGLQATNGAVISGAELVAANGLSVDGALNVSGTANISTLSVADINVAGNLGLQDIDLGSVTADIATVGILTVEDALKANAPCLLMDSVLIDTGMIYVSYEGQEDVEPRLKVVKGTVGGVEGHFGITVAEDKVLTITYAENANFTNLTEDWETYRAAQPDLTAGFKLLQIGGDHYWEAQDRELDLTAVANYREYVDAETGLVVIYTDATDIAPQFVITANESTTVQGFTFEITDQCLTIKYPAATDNCTVSQLISDWDTFISEDLENSGNFELRKTAASTGDALVTDQDRTDLEVNSTGNVYHQAILRTNSVSIKGNLKFYNSALEISAFSDSVTLNENSRACLPTQKAVKTYVDNGLALKADLTTMTTELAKKADVATMTTELAKKADVATMTTELAKKADAATMTTELAKKADAATMTTELAKKADAATMTTELANKADAATMTTELAKKADAATMTTELAKKADAATMTTELAKKADVATITAELEKKADLTTVNAGLVLKADQTTVTSQLAQKADQSAMLTALAAKAGLVFANDLRVAAEATAIISEISLTANSRGILLVRMTTAAGTATAGLFAIHGTESMLKIAGGGMTAQKDNAGTCNLYLESGAVTVQNSLAEAVSIRVSYFGV
jgi:hypothetical protein